MNMKTINKIAAMTAVAVALTLGSGCQKEPLSGVSAVSTERGVPPDGEAGMQGVMGVRLMASNSGIFGSLHMNLLGVSVHRINPATGVSEWVSTRLDPTVYNVLMFNPESPAGIAQFTMPVGVVTEIKLLIGKTNTLAWADKDGRHLITMRVANYTPSVQAKVQVVRGKKALVLLDLNVLNSLEPAGRTDYVFDPMLSIRQIDYDGPDDSDNPQ